MHRQRLGILVGSLVLGIALPVAAQQGGAGNQGQGQNNQGQNRPGAGQGQQNQNQQNRNQGGAGQQPGTQGGQQNRNQGGAGQQQPGTQGGQQNPNQGNRNQAGQQNQQNRNQANQQNQAGSRGWRGPRPWFWDPQIRQQLGIPENSYPRLERAFEDHRNRFNTAAEQLSNLDDQQRQTRLRDLRNTFFKSFNDSLTDVLPADQRARLGQAALQFRGYDAFFDPTVSQRLRLTDLQLQQLGALNDRFNNDLGVVLADPNTAAAERRYGDLRGDMRKQILQVLTPEQDKLWLEMTGDPIPFQLSSELSPGAANDSPSQGSPLDQAFDRCSQACVQCQRVCDTCAAHCARMIANNRIEHLITLRTCQDCADTCSAASRILSRHGPLYETVVRACADSCAQCAQVCAQHPGDNIMSACAVECRACEKACRDFLEEMRQKGLRN